MSDPKIYVLARPSFTNEFDAFLQEEGQEWKGSTSTPAERLVEFAGRICYMAFGVRQSTKTNSEYIGNLIRQEHESVLEHVGWTFLLTNVSRAFTHQLVRHRVGFSFSQLSQQYHDES
jgi:thymidylate synthase (FAD)